MSTKRVTYKTSISLVSSLLCGLLLGTTILSIFIKLPLVFIGILFLITILKLWFSCINRCYIAVHENTFTVKDINKNEYCFDYKELNSVVFIPSKGNFINMLLAILIREIASIYVSVSNFKKYDRLIVNFLDNNKTLKQIEILDVDRKEINIAIELINNKIT